MWTRITALYIFTGQNVQGITDHNYNRPTRPDDNMIPWVLGDSLNIPVYGMPLTHTGGKLHVGRGWASPCPPTWSIMRIQPDTAQVDNYIFQYKPAMTISSCQISSRAASTILTAGRKCWIGQDYRQAS